MKSLSALYVALLVQIAALLLAQHARADVQRFAIIVGNNEGDASDGPLRYAESDATRVYEVLRDLGSFVPANMLLLKGEDARTLEDTIIAVNERVRLALSQPGSQAMLVVYYSGHADADADPAPAPRWDLVLWVFVIKDFQQRKRDQGAILDPWREREILRIVLLGLLRSAFG